MKKYRFFFHYYRQYNCMSVHFRGQCFKVKGIICNVPCTTKWNKRKPNLVMRGMCQAVNIYDEIATIH